MIQVNDKFLSLEASIEVQILYVASNGTSMMGRVTHSNGQVTHDVFEAENLQGEHWARIS